ncbi:MAG: SMP-30/gluconolactonase/LRE family protein, partial [Candidatus Rokuibacteriota bacterium]
MSSLEIRDPRLAAVVGDDVAFEKVAGGCLFTEGPLWHPDGFYYFVDIHRSALYRLTPGKGPELVRADTGEGNGTTFDLHGRLVLCEGGNRRLTRTAVD